MPTPKNVALNYVPAINIKKTDESVLKAYLAPHSGTTHSNWDGQQSRPAFPSSSPEKERSHGCCPYASLLFDNCATLNHSIRLQDQTQSQTRSQLEPSVSLRLGPFPSPTPSPWAGVGVCVWRSPWKVFSHAAATDNSPQKPAFPLHQTAATTEITSAPSD